MRRFQIVSDPHGLHRNERACDASIAFAQDFKPDIRIIAGDLFDFAAIRKGASEEERGQSLAEDYELGMDYAKRFFAGGSERVFLNGNHDTPRLALLAQSVDAARADLGKRMIGDLNRGMARLKAKVLPYDSRFGIYQMGHLKVAHGYFTGTSACAKHAAVYGNVVFGHIHSIESYQVPGLEQREARAIGCLCELDPDYCSAKPGKLRWAHGWAYGWVNDDGSYSLFQVRGVNGKFTAPVQIKTY